MLPLVEFKIYISLKLKWSIVDCLLTLVEFKIYISLKLNQPKIKRQLLQQNSKFTYLSNVCCEYFIYPLSLVEFKIYISLKRITSVNGGDFTLVEFKIYISLKLLHALHHFGTSLVEFKIYISLKPQIEIWSRNFEFGYKKMDRQRSWPEGNLDKIFI